MSILKGSKGINVRRGTFRANEGGDILEGATDIQADGTTFIAVSKLDAGGAPSEQGKGGRILKGAKHGELRNVVIIATGTGEILQNAEDIELDDPQGTAGSANGVSTESSSLTHQSPASVSTAIPCQQTNQKLLPSMIDPSRLDLPNHQLDDPIGTYPLTKEAVGKRVSVAGPAAKSISDKDITKNEEDSLPACHHASDKERKVVTGKERAVEPGTPWVPGPSVTAMERPQYLLESKSAPVASTPGVSNAPSPATVPPLHHTTSDPLPPSYTEAKVEIGNAIPKITAEPSNAYSGETRADKMVVNQGPTITSDEQKKKKTFKTSVVEVIQRTFRKNVGNSGDSSSGRPQRPPRHMSIQS